MSYLRDILVKVDEEERLIRGGMLPSMAADNHAKSWGEGARFVLGLLGEAEGEMPGELFVNGHLFVHVAACPCPQMQAEVARLDGCVRDESGFMCSKHHSFFAKTQEECEVKMEERG